MRVEITAGNNEPAGHYVTVNGHGTIVDLSNVNGTLHDPTIQRVEWGPRVANNTPKESGIIVRQDGGKQKFFKLDLIKPYIVAWTAQMQASSK